MKVSVTGQFGPKTAAALKAFQRRNHLPVTGKADALTWRALPKVKAPASRSADRKIGDRSLGLDGLNWSALARCESGGNPRAVNPAGYYGLYQFSVGTWRGVGGSGLPHRASAQEQTYRAQLLYKRSGSRPWPHCGKFL
ncbi:transglycosylase SLT domain-containing protein [Motilibacter sp. E257]|uniref:Transglycosylase SLT domain-containing protein n=1 Tax=Motilibacter deserti TaxID=2714956 RepID=A0ABX0GWZ3_9ACTN|nr:transglycosylase family protein [Motilibacter deserti]NHC13773.1 transglycosylase SLT domain-containing protein [Motilibacter deserti]